MSLYINLIQNIVNFSDLKTQIKLCSLCQENYYFLKIFILDTSYYSNITQEIIEQNKFNKLRELNILNNIKIYNINFLKFTLEKLDASGEKCRITQKGIQQLIKLKYLNVSDNKNIKSINFVKDIEELNASIYECGITQEEIEQLTKLK